MPNAQLQKPDWRSMADAAEHRVLVLFICNGRIEMELGYKAGLTWIATDVQCGGPAEVEPIAWHPIPEIG